MTDEPTDDDDLTELRRHVEAMADEGLSFASAHAYQEARQALADAAPRLIAEVERLRAAAPQVDADAFERFARTADPAALAELIEKATGAKVESVSTERAAAPPSEDDEATDG